MPNLNGKIAVVTGASKGIGAGIAKGLAAAGAAVVVNYVSSREDAERVVTEIAKQGGKAVAIQGNVAKADDVKRLFAETIKTFGRLDVLVNNAGVYKFAPLEEFTEDLYHWHFNTNVLGLFLVTQEAVRHFGDEGGSIINVGSVATDVNLPTNSVYTATKSAVDSITRSFAKELGPKKIRVNSINPGPVDTEGARALGFLDGDAGKQIIALTPLGRVGYPDDYAAAAAFLASEDSRWITGELIRVAGGLR